MSIEAINITKTFGKQKALDNVSFKIETGNIVGFLGPNGAGKSTMMKIITGFIPATSGQVIVDGLNVDESQIEVKKIIGYLPENNPLYYEMYIREYLNYVAGIYKIGKNKKDRVDQIIELTGLTKEIKKKIGTLSKGYKQRVGLAQAFIHNPKILILDEPTSGLDPNQIIEIRKLIQSFGKDKTVLLSTHIMQEVEAMCKKVIIIDSGKILAYDNTTNIKQLDSEKSFTIIVEFSNNVNITELEKINGIMKVKKLSENNWLIQSNINQDIRPDIFNFAVSKNIAVLSMQKKEKKLEDVFHELTNKK